ncbi:helix-turn-helix domain-containing protein [Clavibacter michiganensis]|uniref:helix-turn-helix domain-containing protein n=1 Tax=Clavibacter michiganensis TaxID=28447 RepID=UPI0034826408
MTSWLRQGVIPGYLVHHSWITFRREVRAWMESTANWAIPARAPDADPLDAYGDVLSADDVAELLRVSRQTVTGWLRAGFLIGHMDLGRWQIEKAAVRAVLREASNRPGSDAAAGGYSSLEGLARFTSEAAASSAAASSSAPPPGRSAATRTQSTAV